MHGQQNVVRSSNQSDCFYEFGKCSFINVWYSLSCGIFRSPKHQFRWHIVWEANIKSFIVVDQMQYLYIPYLQEDQIEACRIS